MTFWEPEAATAERGTALAVVPATTTAGALVSADTVIDIAPRMWKVAEKLAGTPFVPDAFRGKPESVLAAFLTGHELGLPMMQSLAKIHVVNGRPGLAAEVMRSLVLAAGHEIWIEEKSRTSVTVGGKRAGSTREQRVTWTMDDANAAKLAQKDVWKSYPRAMLTARATSELCRDLFPDVIGGLYSVEELDDGFDPALAEDETAPAGPIEEKVRKASSPAARKRLSQKAKAAAGAGPEPEPPPIPEDDDDIAEAEIIEDDDAPPLPEDDEHGTPIPVERAKRAQRIAIQARELEVERAHVISAVTGGEKTSGKELTEAEGDLVLEALRRLKTGEVRLVEVDGEHQLHDAPEVPNEPEGEGSASGPSDEVEEEEPAQGKLLDAGQSIADPGDADEWRRAIRRCGKTLSDTIRQATLVAHELELVPPTDMASLSTADVRLKVAVLKWLTEGDG